MNIFVVSSLILMKYVLSQQEIVQDSEMAEQLYMKLFKRRRSEQQEAVKNLRKSLSYDKQHSMITLMAEKVFTVIQNSRAVIESSSFIPGVSDFPTDERVRDTLSNILENTSLFGEIILRLPDVATAVLKTNNNWDILLQWCIAFTNQMKYLLDKNTVKLLHLVSQELNHIERDPNYVNPYTKRVEVSSDFKDDDKTVKKKKKRNEIKRGPRLINTEL